MAKTLRPPTFAGAPLDGARHVCAFFTSEDEEYRVLLPFIKDGFDLGEKAVHIVSPDRRTRHLERLSKAGIDVAMAERTGQLELRLNTETYLRDGRFDQDRMLGTFENLAGTSSAGTYAPSRIVCQMDWASRNCSCTPDLIEFEARVNDIWSRHDDAVICVYQLSEFRGDTVMDVMRTHPMIVLGGTLQRNPFYVPPAEFLAELRQRRVTSAPRTPG